MPKEIEPGWWEMLKFCGVVFVSAFIAVKIGIPEKVAIPLIFIVLSLWAWTRVRSRY